MNWVPEKLQSQILQKHKDEQGNPELSLHQPKRIFSDSDVFEMIYMGKCMKHFSEKELPVEYRKFLIRRKLVMQLMYTNGLTHWTEPIDGTQPLVGFQTSEVKLKRDHSRFIVLYSHEAEDSHLYYKAFDADSTGKYILKKTISIDRNKNFTFDAEDKG